MQVDEHDLVLGNELTKIDRRSRLPDDGTRYLATSVLVHLGLDRIDDLLSVAQLERIEVAAEPVFDGGVGGALQHGVSETRNAQQVRDFEDGVLRAASRNRIDVADRLVGLEQSHEREAKSVLH